MLYKILLFDLFSSMGKYMHIVLNESLKYPAMNNWLF